MLDIKRIRENLDDIKKAMDRRGEPWMQPSETVFFHNKTAASREYYKWR